MNASELPKGWEYTGTLFQDQEVVNKVTTRTFRVYMDVPVTSDMVPTDNENDWVEVAIATFENAWYGGDDMEVEEVKKHYSRKCNCSCDCGVMVAKGKCVLCDHGAHLYDRAKVVKKA